jgi:hypothetical protein
VLEPISTEGLTSADVPELMKRVEGLMLKTLRSISGDDDIQTTSPDEKPVPLVNSATASAPSVAASLSNLKASSSSRTVSDVPLAKSSLLERSQEGSEDDDAVWVDTP